MDLKIPLKFLMSIENIPLKLQVNEKIKLVNYMVILQNIKKGVTVE